MHYAKPNYKLGENIYKLIDDITQASTTTIEISSNLLFQLSNLFESIEDETTHEIITQMGEINDFISRIFTFSKNELQEIKIKSKICNEKAEKRKQKIIKLKDDNKKLNEKIKELEIDKKRLIINIDDISKELSDLYQKNRIYEEKNNLERIDKKNDEILKEKYLKEINNMQKDIEALKENNKKYESNANKFKRMSMILEEKNKKLNNQLGSQIMQFYNKMKEQNEHKNIINLLRLQNNELSQKIKNYQSQIEKLQTKNKLLEEKIDNLNSIIPKKSSQIIPEINNVNKKSNKKIFKIKKGKDSFDVSEDYDNENENLRYKTFSNLNDLLANESDKSSRKNSYKQQTKKIKIIPKCNFDIDYFFEIHFNVYENFFF